MEVLKKSIPDAQFTLLSPSAEKDKKHSDNSKIKIISWPKGFSVQIQILLGILLLKLKIDPSTALSPSNKANF